MKNNEQAKDARPTTLVIGSTGKTGRRIVRLLEDQGASVRQGSRQADPRFDWDYPSEWPAALHGVHAVYISYYPDLAVPGAPEAIRQLTACARAAGVQRLVLLSGRGEANAHRCEQIVRECGIDYTLLRASWFAQNFSEGHLHAPLQSGVLALPAGDVCEPFVDVDDIAEVAVAALTDERHTGQLYEITGPRLMSFAEVTAEISRVAGRDIAYLPVTSEQFRTAVAEQDGPELADMLTELCNEVLDGRNAMTGDGVQRALGREPRDFTDYCTAAAATGAWDLPA